jgi:hypothetical protein
MPIAQTVVTLLPSIIELVKSFHASANPGAPPVTDADVIAALHSAVATSIATDEAWKAAHPSGA